MRFVITGATGFIGTELSARLKAAGHDVIPIVRNRAQATGIAQSGSIVVADIAQLDQLPPADTVIHLAGLAHSRTAVESAYLRSNLNGTEAVVRAAKRANIRRIVFMSSIKAMGERSSAGFRPDDYPSPVDAYGRSKLAAENIVRRFQGEWVIVRSPLIYGPGVKGNFHRLLQTVTARRPLPVGAIRNRRSMLYLGNCVHGLEHLATSDAANRVALLSDGSPVSTPNLVRTIARNVGVNPRLIPVPVSLMYGAAWLVGRGAEVQKLAGDLFIDHEYSHASLGWKPPYTFEQGIEQTVKSFLSVQS